MPISGPASAMMRLLSSASRLELLLQLVRGIVDGRDSGLAKQVEEVHNRQAGNLGALREGCLPRFEQVESHRAVNSVIQQPLIEGHCEDRMPAVLGDQREPALL